MSHTFEWLTIPFMQKALLGSVLISLASGILGLFVVLRRVVFISMSLAEVSSAAVALSYFIGFDPTLTAATVTLASTFLLAIASHRPSRYPPETLIAIVYMLASSAAIIMISKNPQGEVDLMNVLFGNILTVDHRQLVEALIVSFLALSIVLFFFRYFMFTAFDSEMAHASGISTIFWQSLFYLLLGCVIVTGIRLSGALLTFAYLVIPAYTGLRLSRSVFKVVIFSIVVGPIATFLGLWTSFVKDLPTGPTITFILVIISLISMFIDRWRSK